MTTAGPGNGEGGDLPVILDAAAGIGPVRRWAADPLSLLLLVGATGLAIAALTTLGQVGGTASWLVPALFGIVVAGLALSGST
ncbi:hypothetical protein [Ornithinimicrobium pratense]|uniref:Uncharacterized protein n=1 Tax=Ornithinimicrobium pratense TaxID=2593973 RepID=A0A5J6V155_9MICO|nr:hypothetical protein [Ornithinimicrobium pratense]QFG67419.1 hypothetical protein FY030_00595 [Ornithinimicrobium pratense]